MSKTHAKPRASSAPGITAAPVPSGSAASDWVRLPRPKELLCGLTRAYLYHLLERGKIRSIVIADDGKKRGCRLVSLRSIEAFLQQLDAEQNAGGAK